MGAACAPPQQPLIARCASLLQVVKTSSYYSRYQVSYVGDAARQRGPWTAGVAQQHARGALGSACGGGRGLDPTPLRAAMHRHGPLAARPARPSGHAAGQHMRPWLAGSTAARRCGRPSRSAARPIGHGRGAAWLATAICSPPGPPAAAGSRQSADPRPPRRCLCCSAGQVPPEAPGQDRLPRSAAPVQAGQEQVQHPQVQVKAHGALGGAQAGGDLARYGSALCAESALREEGALWEAGAWRASQPLMEHARQQRLHPRRPRAGPRSEPARPPASCVQAHCSVHQQGCGVPGGLRDPGR